MLYMVPSMLFWLSWLVELRDHSRTLAEAVGCRAVHSAAAGHSCMQQASYIQGFVINLHPGNTVVHCALESGRSTPAAYFRPLLQSFRSHRNSRHSTPRGVRSRTNGRRISWTRQRHGPAGVAVRHTHRLDVSFSPICLPYADEVRGCAM